MQKGDSVPVVWRLGLGLPKFRIHKILPFLPKYNKRLFIAFGSRFLSFLFVVTNSSGSCSNLPSKGREEKGTEFAFASPLKS